MKIVSLPLMITMLLTIIMASTTQAQDAVRPQPLFWYGVSGAANFNYYTGTTQTLNESRKAPAAFHKGFGVNRYAAIFMEYRPGPMWGAMLSVAYNNKGGEFDEAMAPCDCPESLTTKLSYLTVEPNLRFAPFSSAHLSGFYLFMGPAISFNLNKSFLYTQKLKSDVKGNFSDVRGTVLSGQIGVGFDIPLSPAANPTQISISPFISYHPYFGQDPRTIESWSITTLQVGMALKFGMAVVK